MPCLPKLSGCLPSLCGAPAKQCECIHHAVASNGSSTFFEVGSFAFNYYTVANNTPIISQSITITKTCCVNIVATMVWYKSFTTETDYDLERPIGNSVRNQRVSYTMGVPALGHWGGWEVLPPGTYTYYLMNHSGLSSHIYAAQIKIVAFDCEGCKCKLHAHAYNEQSGTTPESKVIDRESYANNATLISRAITITEESCVLAIAEVAEVFAQDINHFRLERPLGVGVVDQEDATNTAAHALLHYASWEVLPPGTYTYYVVNRSGALREVGAVHLKIIASTCVEI